MACVGVHVLAVEIIELVVALGTLVKHDFARPAGLRSLAGLRAEHGAFDFACVDSLFHEHTPIMVGRFEHGGGNEGFTCFLVAYQDLGLGAAIMTNSSNGPRVYNELLDAIARAYDWPGFVEADQS